MRRIFGVLGALLLLSGCANTLDGEVTNKYLDPGYVTVQYVSSSCGTNCTTMIPITIYIPPCYGIEVVGADDKATGSTCLNESEWNNIDEGDNYVGPDVKPEDRKEEVE